MPKETAAFANAQQNIWRSWYSFFPWEDWREGKPDILGATIEPHLDAWAARAASAAAVRSRRTRIAQTFWHWPISVE